MANGSDVNMIDKVMIALEQKGTSDDSRRQGLFKRGLMKLWGFIYEIGIMLKFLNRKARRKPTENGIFSLKPNQYICMKC